MNRVVHLRNKTAEILLAGTLILLSSCTERSTTASERARSAVARGGNRTSVARSLTLAWPGGKRVFEFAYLDRKLGQQQVRVHDPVYKDERTYKGFRLTAVLGLIEAQALNYDLLVFRCVDGYEATLPREMIDADDAEGMLAVGEVGALRSWEPIPGKGGTPAPFYLVWKSLDTATHVVDPSMRPWPYQIRSIELSTAATHFAELRPTASVADEVKQGFRFFARDCLRCHALSGRGGTIGPDLNRPMNVMRVWQHDALARFIRNPTEVKERSTMPAMSQIGDEELRRIFAFLRWLGPNPSTEPSRSK